MSTTQEPAVSDGGLLRVRIDLAYDGTDFSGWAAQPGRRTVQGVVEQALAVVLGLPEPASLTVAGRTDSGVHARGQVAHADLPIEHAALVGEPLRRRLDGALPNDVAVRAVAAAAAGFDARFSAVWRRYAYRVADSPAHVDPLRRDVLRHPRPLDLELLNAAARELVGLHDFAAFCRRREGATTVRELLELRWDRDDTGLAVATVRADAFCHSMVRALVGALLPVGDGRRAVGWPAAVLDGGVRDSAVMVVAPHGLTLEEVRYPADADLLGRAHEARRPRHAG